MSLLGSEGFNREFSLALPNKFWYLGLFSNTRNLEAYYSNFQLYRKVIQFCLKIAPVKHSTFVSKLKN